MKNTLGEHMKGIKINWGVLANIEEDLNEQGYSLGEQFENMQFLKPHELGGAT